MPEPTEKQRENTRNRIARTLAIITRGVQANWNDQRIAEEIVRELENPILRLLRDEERSRSRLIRLIKAQGRLIESYAKRQDGRIIKQRQDLVTQARRSVDTNGDMQALDLPPEQPE